MDKSLKTGGRQKGTPNKFTGTMKDAFLCVYQDMQNEHEGDTEHSHLLAWAKENQSDFYKICAKLIPQQINADVTHRDVPAEMTDAELTSIARTSSDRVANKAKSTNKVH